MPNKTYWNQVQEIMEFTDAMGSLLGKEAYSEGDRQETQEIVCDVKERKERANDKPMEMITLAGLAREFKDVAKETRANYRNAESEKQKKRFWMRCWNAPATSSASWRKKRRKFLATQRNGCTKPLRT